MKKQFVKIPMEFLKRKDVTPAAKLIIGYIFTRSNIEETKWLLNAADVIANTGLSDGTISNVFQDLMAHNMITFVHSEIQKKGQYPTKIYSINDAFISKMSVFKSTERPRKSTTSRLRNEPAAVQSLNGGRSKNETVAVQGMRLKEYSTGKEEVEEYPVAKEEAKIDPTPIVPTNSNVDWVNALQAEMKRNTRIAVAVDYKSLPRSFSTSIATREKLESN